MRHRIVFLGISVVLALGAAGCGEPPITAEDESFAAIEAGWQCQVSRRTFTDFGHIAEARVEFVDANGLSMDRYLEGVKELPDRPALRQLVAAQYDRRCGA